MRQDQFAQVPLMGRAPIALALVTITVPQKEPFQAMAAAPSIINRISPRPAQIAQRFIGRFRNVDGRQFPGPEQARQFARIAPIGFDSLAWTGRSQGRSDYFALHPHLLEAPRNPKAARPRFVAGPQEHLFAMRFAQSHDPFLQPRMLSGLLILPVSRTSPRRPASATTVAIQSLWTSSPK